MIKIFNHYFHKLTLLQIFFDLGVIVGGVSLAVLTHLSGLASSSIPGIVVTKALFFAIGILIINSGLGLYDRAHSRTVGQTSARAMLSLCLALPLSYVILRLSPLRLDDEFGFLVILVTATALMLVNRVHVIHAKSRVMMRPRVLVYGAGRRAELVGKTLKKSDPNVDLVGYYASPNETVKEVSAWGLLSTEKSLTDVVLEHQVDQIVVALSERRGGSMPLRELLDCKLQGVRVVDIATYFEITLGQIRLDAVSAGWLIFGEGFNQGLVRTLIKRVFDIVCATLLILLSLPVMLVAAVLILIESGSPIFYFQERVGLNGRLFNVVKFRSMRTDAEKDGKPRWASATDDRVTRVGRVIRKLRIDELPQLVSVLGGDMSLVGPRPERPFFVDKLTQEMPYYAVRQSVKPGLTGWAQVRYHYGASIEDSAEKLQYDLYYVKNHSLFLDIVVLFETVGVVLLGKGAQ